MKINLFEEFPKHSKKDWIDQIIRDLRGKDFEKTLVSVTEDGIKVNPFYTAEDMNLAASLSGYRNRVNAKPSIPGMPPRIWSNVSSFEVTNGKTTNEEILDALLNGADGLLLHLRGREELEVLLKGVEPQYIQIFLSPIGDPIQVLNCFMGWVNQNGWKPDTIHGGILWDGFAAALFEKTDKRTVVEIAKSLLQIGEEFGNFKVLSIDAAAYHNSGASPVQELAFGLAAWIDLIDALVGEGFYPQEIIQKTMFRLAVGADFFLEIAKVKAARILMHRMISLYRLDIPAEDLFLFVETSFWTKTASDPDTDMIRNTTEAMAGIIGGANALYVLPHDIATEIPGTLSERLARNVSIILKEESYLDRILDPVAGSYFIENLIVEIFQKVKESLSHLEELGGWWTCYESGYVQNEVKALRKIKMEDVLEGKKSKIGVNKYAVRKEIMNLKSKAGEEEVWALSPCRESSMAENLTRNL